LWVKRTYVIVVLLAAMIDVALICLFILSVVTLLAGVLMFFAPGSIVRAGNVLNRWVSFDRWLSPLESPWRIERYFYRKHVFVGAVIVIAALYTLLMLLINFEGVGAASKSLGVHEDSIMTWLVESVVMFVILGSFCTLIIGIIVIVRPSILKGFESWMNRWVRTDRVLDALDAPHGELDRLFSYRHRLVGLMVMAGSLYVTATVLAFLR